MLTAQHPVHALAYWGTSASETQSMAAAFDALVGDDPTKRQQLLALMNWASEQRALDDAYNDSYNN